MLAVDFKCKSFNNLEVVLQDEILVFGDGLLFTYAACGEDSQEFVVVIVC